MSRLRGRNWRFLFSFLTWLLLVQVVCNLGESANETTGHKPTFVNMQIDVEKKGDEEHIFPILDQIEQREWRVTCLTIGDSHLKAPAQN